MIRVRVPATTANVGPGFDTLGIALTLYNEIEVEEVEKGLFIEIHGRDGDKIDTDEKNLVYQSIIKTFDKIGHSYKGLRIKQYNNIPIARGLGSSAACIVGGVVVANKLCGGVLSQQELLDIAVEIEGHPDNVAPALLGGVVVSCYDEGTTNYVRFPVNDLLKFTVAIPEVVLSTESSRGVLPQKVGFKDAVFNVGKSSLLVAALMSGELDKISYALEDRLHQPYRVQLIDSLKDLFDKAKSNGIKELFLSGAGPSVIYLNWDADKIEEEKKFCDLVRSLPEKWQVKSLEGDNQGTM